MVFAVLLKPSTETNPERLQEYRFKVYFVYFIAFLVIIGAALLCDSMGKVQDSTSTKALSADSNANQARFGAARVLSFSEAKELRGALAISDTHGCVWAVLEDDDQLKLVRYVNAGDSALCAKSPEVN
jgi:hypothetical protein